MRRRGGLFPTQDGIDRSEAFALIAGLTFADDSPHHSAALWEEASRLNPQMRSLLEQAANEAVREIAPQARIVRQPAVRYPIGPASDGLFISFIVTLWEGAKDSSWVPSLIADAWAITEITRRVKTKIDERIRSAGAKHTAPSLTLTPYVLQKLCEGHVRRTYHPRAKLTGNWFSVTTEFYAGYRSPAHPTGDMEYLVTITAGRTTYCYVLDGTGRAGSHYLRQGEREISLPLPNLMDPSGDAPSRESGLAQTEKSTPVDNPYGIDHSGQFTIIAQLLPAPGLSPTTYADLSELGSQLRVVLEEAVAGAAAEVLGDELPARQTAQFYQVGPAAEQFPTYFITLWDRVQDVAPILSGVADAWAVSEIIRRVHVRLAEWVAASGKRSVRPRLVLTPYNLVKLCEYHVRRTYHPRAKLSTDWFVTNLQMPDYGFPAHPIGMEEYLVTVKVGRRTYCYAIDGHATVESHYLKEGKRLIPLTTPEFILDADEPGESVP